MRAFAGEHLRAAACELVGAQPVATRGPRSDAPRLFAVQTFPATEAAHEGLRLEVPGRGSFGLVHRTADYPPCGTLETAIQPHTLAEHEVRRPGRADGGGEVFTHGSTLLRGIVSV
jgi:hypothetical protein